MTTLCLALLFVTFLAAGNAYYVYDWGDYNGCGNTVFEETIKISPLESGYRRTAVNYPTYVSLIGFLTFR